MKGNEAYTAEGASLQRSIETMGRLISNNVRLHRGGTLGLTVLYLWTPKVLTMRGLFSSVLEQIRGPLSIVALSFLILYGIYLRVLKLPVFQPIGPKGTRSMLTTVLSRLFWLAVIALVLGLGSYIASLYINRRPSKLTSSTRLLDARLDPGLTSDATSIVFPKAKDFPKQRLRNRQTGRQSDYAVTATEPNTSEPSLAAVDFKFQNTGQGTAFLWKVGLEIENAEINLSPNLYFRYHVNNGELHLETVNTGWGNARCEVSFQNKRIEEWLGNEDVEFRGPVASGSHTDQYIDIRRLPPRVLLKLKAQIKEREFLFSEVEAAIKHKDAKRLQVLRQNPALAPESSLIGDLIKEMENPPDKNDATSGIPIDVKTLSPTTIESLKEMDYSPRGYFSYPKRIARRAVPIGEITVSGSCIDETNRIIPVHESVPPWQSGSDCTESLWLNPDGFQNEVRCSSSISINIDVPSEPTFAAVLDPEAVPTEVSYQSLQK
jgi:hypothetical protein